MKKNKVSKIMLAIAVVAIICCISTINKASSNVNDLIQNITELPGTTTQDNNVANTTTQNITPIGNSTANNTVKNISTNTTTLPKTGVDDTILWILIGVSAVAAIYTYKKVRDYNV